MVSLLTADGVEEVDYVPSDSEIRTIALTDSALYGIVLWGATWIKRADGSGFWTVCAGRRVDAVPAALGWCWSCDGVGRGYWTDELQRVPLEVRALYGESFDDDDP